MKSLPPILAALALLLLLLGGYVGAYVGMGESELYATLSEDDQGQITQGAMYQQRIYHYEWLPPLFVPAAWVESQLSGIRVEIDYRDPALKDW